VEEGEEVMGMRMHFSMGEKKFTKVISWCGM